MTVNFGVSYLGVILATIAAMIVGFVWFAQPVFGRRWAAYEGVPLGRPGPEFALAILAALVNSYVLALFALNLGGTTATDAIALGVLVWLGFFATALTADTLFRKKPWGLWAINVGHSLVAQLAIALFVTLVR